MSATPLRARCSVLGGRSGSCERADDRALRTGRSTARDACSRRPAHRISQDARPMIPRIPISNEPQSTTDRALIGCLILDGRFRSGQAAFEVSGGVALTSAARGFGVALTWCASSAPWRGEAPDGDRVRSPGAGGAGRWAESSLGWTRTSGPRRSRSSRGRAAADGGQVRHRPGTGRSRRPDQCAYHRQHRHPEPYLAAPVGCWSSRANRAGSIPVSGVPISM